VAPWSRRCGLLGGGPHTPGFGACSPRTVSWPYVVGKPTTQGLLGTTYGSSTVFGCCARVRSPVLAQRSNQDGAPFRTDGVPRLGRTPTDPRVCDVPSRQPRPGCSSITPSHRRWRRGRNPGQRRRCWRRLWRPAPRRRARTSVAGGAATPGRRFLVGLAGRDLGVVISRSAQPMPDTRSCSRSGHKLHPLDESSQSGRSDEAADGARPPSADQHRGTPAAFALPGPPGPAPVTVHSSDRLAGRGRLANGAAVDAVRAAGLPQAGADVIASHADSEA